MFGGLAFFLDRFFWIDRLGHMHFVAGPLLGLLIGIMRIRMVGVLFRTSRPLGNNFQLSSTTLNCSSKTRRRSFTASRSASLGLFWADPLQQISHILSTLPMQVSLLDFA